MQQQSESQAPEGPVIVSELADGSRLVIDEPDRPPHLCRFEEPSERITLEDAMRLSGQPFAGYRLLRG